MHNYNTFEGKMHGFLLRTFGGRQDSEEIPEKTQADPCREWMGAWETMIYAHVLQYGTLEAFPLRRDALRKCASGTFLAQAGSGSDREKVSGLPDG